MRALLLALSLAAAFVVLVPAASASPCPESAGSTCPPPCGVGAMLCYALPVSVCVQAVQPTCPGSVCVLHPTLAFIPNPTCLNLVAKCLTCDPDVQNLRDCLSTNPCHEAFTTCTEGDDLCGHNLACVVTYGGKAACVYDPCSEMACF